MKQMLIWFTFLTAVTAAAGTGGWLVWDAHREQGRARARLDDTLTTLTQSHEALALVEDERRRLSEDYELLKRRWTTAEEELKDLRETSGSLRAELKTVQRERTDLTHRFEEVKAGKQELWEQVDALEQESAALEAERASLAAHLEVALHHSLTLAEAEQIGQAIAAQQAQLKRLGEQLASRQAGRPGAFVPDDAPPGEIPDARVEAPNLGPQAAVPPSPVGTAAVRPSHIATRAASALLNEEAAAFAAHYRRLGDTHLASHDYASAADAFENSLALRDDPEVHARLAFLYSRLLHDPVRARQHAARAPERDHGATALRASTRAKGLPRSGLQQLRNWLR